MTAPHWTWPPIGLLVLAVLLLVWGIVTALSIPVPSANVIFGLWAAITGLLILIGR